MNSTNFHKKILDYLISFISSRSFPHCEYRLRIGQQERYYSQGMKRGQDCQNMTMRNRTAGTGQMGQDIPIRTATTGQPHRTSQTGQLGQYS
jgi:hypothetical protein